jgi:hypothetical protein
MGLKDRLNAALERANAGRQAKLGAKSDVAYDQGNLKKGARLDMRSKKVALRSEKRQAIGDAKNSMKIGKLAGKAIKDVMRSSEIAPLDFQSKAQQQEADALERAKKYKGGQY